MVFKAHSYHAKDGKLKGKYCNINTPVELYPYGKKATTLQDGWSEAQSIGSASPSNQNVVIR